MPYRYSPPVHFTPSRVSIASQVVLYALLALAWFTAGFLTCLVVVS